MFITSKVLISPCMKTPGSRLAYSVIISSALWVRQSNQPMPPRFIKALVPSKVPLPYIAVLV